MRKRSRFCPRLNKNIDLWPNFLKVAKQNIPKIHTGNYCVWTENKKETDKLSKALKDSNIEYYIDWEYSIAENSDIENLKPGQKIQLKLENMLGKETSWYRGIVTKIVTSNNILRLQFFGGLPRKHRKEYQVPIDKIRAIEIL